MVMEILWYPMHTQKLWYPMSTQKLWNAMCMKSCVPKFHYWCSPIICCSCSLPDNVGEHSTVVLTCSASPSLFSQPCASDCHYIITDWKIEFIWCNGCVNVNLRLEFLFFVTNNCWLPPPTDKSPVIKN